MRTDQGASPGHEGHADVSLRDLPARFWELENVARSSYATVQKWLDRADFSSSGRRADITEAESLGLVALNASIADKAYDADPCIEKLEERGLRRSPLQGKTATIHRTSTSLLYRKKRN